jgi:CheY-like chemotaxis protein
MSQKVLVFESDAAFAGELRNELGKFGCTVQVVDDGNSGLQQAAALRPDLILLSIELPRMNGFSVCNKLKKDPALKDVPLIILSSESNDDTFEQHKRLRTRAEDYVHKPVSFGDLLARIQPFVTLTRTGGSVSARPSEQPEDIIVIDEDLPLESVPPSLSDNLQLDDAFDRAQRVSSHAPRQMSDKPAFKPSMPPLPFKIPVDENPHEAAPKVASKWPPAPSAAPSAVHAAPGSIPAARPASLPAAMPVTGMSMNSTAAAQRRDLDEAQANIERLTADLDRSKKVGDEYRLRSETAEADVERQGREIDELKTKVAQSISAARNTGSTSREFLDLREALNKKDKEILSFREQLSKKDREIVEARDASLALERSKGDLEEKLLTQDRQLAELRETEETLTAARDEQAIKLATLEASLASTRAALETGKHDLQKAQESAANVAADRRKLEEALVETERRIAEQAEQAEQIQATFANLKTEHAAALKRLDETTRIALDEAEQKRMADLDAATVAHETMLSEESKRLTAEKLRAVDALRTELANEHSSKLALLHRAHEAEQTKAKESAEQERRAQENKHQEHVEAQQTQTKTELALAVTAIKEIAERELAETKEASANELKRAVADLEAMRAEELAAKARENAELAASLRSAEELRAQLVASHGSELGEFKEEAQRAEARLAKSLEDTRSELASAEARHADLVEKVRIENERNAALAGDLSATKQNLSDTEERLSLVSDKASAVTAKWEKDQASLSRAKDALAVVLSQIEEAELRAP